MGQNDQGQIVIACEHVAKTHAPRENEQAVPPVPSQGDGVASGKNQIADHDSAHKVDRLAQPKRKQQPECQFFNDTDVEQIAEP